MQRSLYFGRWWMLATLLVGVTVCLGVNAGSAGDTKQPKPPAPPGLIDSPIPPGNDPEPPRQVLEMHLTTGPYCVSVGAGDARFGMIQTFHQADRGNLDVVRGSIANAYRLTAMQHEAVCSAKAVKAGGKGQADAILACKVQAAELRAKADRGVTFLGEPTSTLDGRPMMVGDDPGVTCVCATYYGADVTGAAASCGGPCGNCWFCR